MTLRDGRRRVLTFSIVLLSANKCAEAAIFSYEAAVLPDQAGWTVSQVYCNPGLWVVGGLFFERVNLCDGVPPPGGQSASYKRSIDEFIGAPTFFLEWRAQSDADRSEISWGGGGAISAFSSGDVNYVFAFARDQAELNRDNLLPIIHFDIQAGVPHTYRLELIGLASYAWYIDGQLLDSGVPEGAFPSFGPRIIWRAKAAWLPNTTSWDYIRYGTIPQPGSGDFDSNGTVDANDVYFFLDCLLGPDSAGPGCRWADMNNDLAVNGGDVQLFAAALLAP